MSFRPSHGISHVKFAEFLGEVGSDQRFPAAPLSLAQISERCEFFFIFIPLEGFMCFNAP